MGIAGAAWATVISQVVSALVLLAYIPKFRSVHFERSDFKLSFEDVKVIASLGLTSFIFQIFCDDCTNHIEQLASYIRGTIGLW